MPTILITGANRGLGLEFSKQYLEDGWKVIATCRKPELATSLLRLSKKYKNALFLKTLDVSKFNEIKKLAKQIVEPIDIIISNAGMLARQHTTFGKIDYELWQKTLVVNSLAPLVLAENFFKHLKRGSQKKFVVITSRMGSITNNTTGGYYIYRSSKSALNSIVKNLSIDLTIHHIISLLFHPGSVKTAIGGPHALILPKKSVEQMRKIICIADEKLSGQFLNYDGDEIPW